MPSILRAYPVLRIRPDTPCQGSGEQNTGVRLGNDYPNVTCSELLGLAFRQGLGKASHIRSTRGSRVDPIRRQTRLCAGRVYKVPRQPEPAASIFRAGRDRAAGTGGKKRAAQRVESQAAWQGSHSRRGLAPFLRQQAEIRPRPWL